VKPFIYLSFLAAGTLLVSDCGRHKAVKVTEPNEERSLPPAANAQEWIKRMNVDDKYSLYFPERYSQLPPQAEWPIIEAWMGTEGKPPTDLKLRIFRDLLRQDSPQVSKGLRELLLTDKEIEKYAYSKILFYLTTFAESPEEARKWAETHLSTKDSFPSRSEEDKLGKLLADNRIDEALVVLREKINAEEDPDEKIELLGEQAKIARLLERKPLYESTVAEMKALVVTIKPGTLWGLYSISPYLDEMILQKDWQAVRATIPLLDESNSEGKFQIKLFTTYHIEGPAAFTEELKNARNYGIEDVFHYLNLLTEENLKAAHLGEMAVQAFQATGETEKARITLTYLLALQMGNDALYRMAIEFFPGQAAAIFESLRPFNPYEERPLIWLADLALAKGDLAKAQSLINEVITLDPSDGEQGKETRMQAYDVLSRILRAQGDGEKANFFAEVVKSIRLGEAADDFLEAGLTKEAIRRYQEALGHFQDAYCLQSRLANTLLKEGKVDEAMVHFRKAFELMPVSFGPVESHCFGCEGVFKDERVQKVAEETFAKIITSTPQNPRTYYLMGLLHEEMKQPEQAVTFYRKAWELDPRYYNCAVKLVNLLKKSSAGVAEAQAMLPHLIGIAPYPNLAGIYHSRTDLKQAWEDAQTAPPSPLKLEPLPLPFTPLPADGIRRVSYSVPALYALDGWSAQELLDENELLDWLDSF